MNWWGVLQGALCAVLGCGAFCLPQRRAVRRWRRSTDGVEIRLIKGLTLAGIPAKEAAELTAQHYKETIDRLFTPEAPAVAGGCTGSHTCRPGHLPVSWCRESCSMCSGDNARPCFANHPKVKR